MLDYIFKKIKFGSQPDKEKKKYSESTQTTSLYLENIFFRFLSTK